MTMGSCEVPLVTTYHDAWFSKQKQALASGHGLCGFVSAMSAAAVCVRSGRI